MLHAVVQYRLQPVVVIARHVDFLIDHDSGGALADALSHYACLAVIDCNALLEGDRGDLDRESANRAGE